MAVGLTQGLAGFEQGVTFVGYWRYSLQFEFWREGRTFHVTRHLVVDVILTP
jgi:hypothetical protein